MSTIYQRPNGNFYINYMLQGRQIRHSLRTKDEEIARARAAALLTYRQERIEEPPAYQPPGHHPEREDLDWTSMVSSGEKSGKWLWALYQRTRDRARSRDIPFTLNREQLRMIATRSDGYCEVTGLPFSWQKPTESQFPPYAPGLDRLSPQNGYTAGNCRLVCHAANMALCDWGEEVLERMARAFLQYHGKL